MLRAILSQEQDGSASLSAEELHHLVRVRRLRRGEPFLGLSLEEKLWYRCCLLGDGPAVDLLNREEEPARPAFPVTLGQALIQRDRFDWVVQKSVELGVAAIVPVQTVRTEFKLKENRQQKQLARWQRIAREAVKQCGRCELPELCLPMDLERFLELPPPLKLYLDERDGESLKPLLQESSALTEAIILVGPEGGWTEEERDLIRREGFRPVYLGSTILRSETAALALLGILQYERGGLA